MKRSIVWFPLAIFVLAGWSTEDADGQSLFDRRDPRQYDLHTNYVAKSKGDLLVVIINENTGIATSDARTLEKSGSSQIDGSLNYGLTGKLGNESGGATFGSSTSGDRDFEGDSQFNSDRQFRDRFTVTVIDVLPNGNLLVAGRRKIDVEGDIRTLELTGTVRELDVLPGNTISSQSVANLKLRLIAEGPEQSFTKQGWLGRGLNRIWPF